MNIVIRELKANFKSFLIWFASLSFFLVMMLTEFSAFYQNPELAQIIAVMPKELLEAFGMAGIDLTTLSGFIGMSLLYFSLMLGIYAILLGSGILAKEERDKTAEFLMVMPIKRGQIWVAKWLVGVLYNLIFIVLIAIVLLASVQQYEIETTFYTFLGLSFTGLFILTMVYYHLGLFLAAWLKRHHQSPLVSMGIIVITYLFTVFIGLSEKLAFLKYFSPFKYFEAKAIIDTQQLDGQYLLIALGCIVICGVASYLIYPKRDVYL